MRRDDCQQRAAVGWASAPVAELEPTDGDGPDRDGLGGTAAQDDCQSAARQLEVEPLATEASAGRRSRALHGAAWPRCVRASELRAQCACDMCAELLCQSSA